MTRDTLSSQIVADRSISEAELWAAQSNWCDALIDIGKAYTNGGHAQAKVLAEKLVDELYAYQLGPVLFKPTLATSPQTFRTTRAGAVSYFVGGDPEFPNDVGFALNGWTKCKVENVGIYIAGSNANTMGKAHFTGPDGRITTVDKTWGFLKDDQGALRIILHHSSLEYVK